MGTDHQGVEAVNYGFEPAAGGGQTLSGQDNTDQNGPSA
jgi:hypothetical protein